MMASKEHIDGLEYRLKLLAMLGSVLYLAWNYYNRSLNVRWFMCDFNVYYNFSHYGDRYGWFYKDWLASIWLFFESPAIWYVLMSSCILFLTWKFLEMKYGWVLVAPFLKVSGWMLGSGNILPLLAVACLTPMGCLAAGLVKPQLLGFLFLHAVKRSLGEIRQRSTPNLVQRPRPTIPLRCVTHLQKIKDWWNDYGMKYALDETTRRKV
jgi:hypothetical protein